MSDESISHREDRENLLYIFKKIKKLEQIQIVGDDVDARESSSSSEEITSMTDFEHDLTFSTVIGKQAGPEIFNDPEMIAKTKPFDFTWTYGLNSKVGLINLTTEDRKEILFAGSHFPILYDYSAKQMKCLEGHQHPITYISADGSGRWLLTADDYKDGYVILWDREELKPVYTLFNIYSVNGTIVAKLSWSARYLITIGIKNEGSYSVDFWLWTYGNEDPNDSFEVDKKYGPPMDVCFNPNIEEFIMLIFKKQVILLVWDVDQNKFSKPKIPSIQHRDRIGFLTTGTYFTDCHKCYACSTKGCILVFNNTIYSKPYDESSVDNSKNFINAIKVTNYVIRTCATTANSLVVADSSGTIFFFDKFVRLMYWFKDFNLGPIDCISFNLLPNVKEEDQSAIYIAKPCDSHIFGCEFVDLTDELEKLFKENLPKDASLKNDPFLANDFFVGTEDGNVYAIDFFANKCIPIFMMTDEVSALEIHEEHPFLLIAFKSGRINMVNYNTNELIYYTIIPQFFENCTAISCLKYSPDSLHLVCGRENGEFWILEPISLNPKIIEPLRPTKNKIQKIVFSKNVVQLAYFDINLTVVLLRYNLEECQWKYIGKLRSHYEPINDIIFMPVHHKSILYTIACDRHLVGYNNSSLEANGLIIDSKHRIEQKAIPMAMIHWVEIRGGIDWHFFLIADNEHKFKLLDVVTKVPIAVILAPAYGCFKNQVIGKMMPVPKGDLVDVRYMAFLSSRFIGLHIVPPDGNPYKYVGYMAHPSKVVDFCLSPDGKYIFTFGTDDKCVFKWKLKTKAVELMYVLGGKELEPYYCLIEGGKNGWLFHEIKDLFYYMQILQHDPNSSHPIRVSDTVDIEDIPDLVRTCGFFPSEFELENMMIDIQYRSYHETALLNTEINFIDFVKLYCNHKPVYGYSKEKIKNAFETIVQNSESTDDEEIDRDQFCQIMSYTGEIISPTCLIKLMKTLMRSDDAGGTYEFLPEAINYKILSEEIFGIDMTRAKIITSKQPDPDKLDDFNKEEIP